MKKSLIAVVATGGLALGGMSIAQVASANDGGTAADTPAVELEADADNGTLIPVQDPAPDADGPDQAEGERQGRRGHHGGCGDLETAATAIGVSVDDLRAAREDGQSIADVATANGVDPDTVVDAMVDAASDKIAEKVDAGELTQAEADEKLDGLAERISERVFAVPGDRAEDAQNA